MGDPITMMMIASAVQGGAQVYQGVQTNKHMKAQAQQQEFAAANQRLQNLRELNATLGTQRTVMAARGVQLSGSALMLQKQTMEYGMTNINAAYHQGMMGASLTRSQGKTAQTAGLLSGIGTAMSGYSGAKQKQSLLR